MSPDGLGEYFGQGGGDLSAVALPQHTGLPSAPPVPLPMPVQRGEPTGGLGGYFGRGGAPAHAWTPQRRSGSAWKMAASLSPVAGALGDTADVLSRKRLGEVGPVMATVNMTAILVGLVLRGGAGYLVGTALAPSAKDERAYAWTGAAASLFLGSLGLGAQALYARQKRRG